jgi:hypothetical protein
MFFFEFDFRLHTDLSTLDRRSGPSAQYFEFTRGPYGGEHWLPGSAFILEYTFCLVEGIFEKCVPGFDHFSYVEVSGSQWELILGDLAALRAALIEAGETSRVALPYAEFPSVRPSFEHNWVAYQPKLASLLFSLDQWVIEALARYGSVSVLGL